jgi:hypothetical protein
MKTKIKAHKPVSVLTIQGSDRIWVRLLPGDTEIAGMVIGIAPEHLPNMAAGNVGGERHVPLGECLPGDLPKQFHGLFTIESMTR